MRLILRKVSALILIALSSFFAYGTYTVLWTDTRNYAGDFLLRELSWGIDAYTALAVLILLGFLFQWAIFVRKSNRVATALFIMTLVGFLWLWLMTSRYVGPNGFETVIWTNMIAMGINSLFSIGIFSVRS